MPCSFNKGGLLWLFKSCCYWVDTVTASLMLTQALQTWKRKKKNKRLCLQIWDQDFNIFSSYLRQQCLRNKANNLPASSRTDVMHTCMWPCVNCAALVPFLVTDLSWWHLHPQGPAWTLTLKLCLIDHGMCPEVNHTPPQMILIASELMAYRGQQ